jgi:gag-polypeptide of LTR copia-type
MDLEIKFKNFTMEDHESIEEIYNRLLSIQNKFSDLDEPLTNNKVIGKILRVILRMPRWEALVSALETMQGINDAFYAG